jgi:hypothetical protein
MNYVLVQNKQTILLGPIFWRHRFIQSELDDLEIEYVVSPVEPNEYVKINDELEIYPVTGLEVPEHHSDYQQLAGPFWTFTDVAHGIYNVVDRPFDAIKNTLKAQVSAERYRKEIAGIKLTIQDTEVSVATDRDSRNIYTQKLVTMGDDVVQWKFSEAWLSLNKQELTQMLVDVNSHVQQQFDWESNIINQIDLAETVEQLKEIVIVEVRDTEPSIIESDFRINLE